ncbi:MAG: YraN family protein [Mediterranea sp.]|nr:YraN family protein [Mediterranea sp.]
MAEHNILGKAGEDAASDYLLRNNYIIRHRNWRKGHLELDIVAVKDGMLIIIEVKTRENIVFALPQDAVTAKKIKRTVWAADMYIKHFQLDTSVRFDIITVVGQEGNFKIKHIEEAFYPPLWSPL